MIPAEPDPLIHRQLVRYVLDEVGEAERDDIEVRLLEDAEFQEQLGAAELEVAELFEKKLLTPDQARLVRRKFGTSPSWQQNVYFCRAMAAQEASWSAPRSHAAKTPVFRFAVPAAALVLLAAGLALWFALRPSMQNRGEINRPNVFLAEYVLLPTPLKGVEIQKDNTVWLPQRTGPIKLRMILTSDFYSEYEVRLLALSTGAAQSLGTVKPDRGSEQRHELSVELDSSQMKPGRYTIVLSAAQQDGSVVHVGGYSFQAVSGPPTR